MINPIKILWQKLAGDDTPGKRVIVKNSLWLLLEKVTLLGGALVLSIIFARVLGKEGFGRYNYIVSFVALFAPLFALGMVNVLLREFSKYPQKVPQILQTCLTSRLLCGSVAVLITMAVVYWVYGAGWKFQLIFALLAANIFNAFEVFERWFQHKSLNSVLVKWRVLCFGFFALLKVWVIWQYQAVMPIILVMAVEVLVKNIGYGFLYKKFKELPEKGRFVWAQFVDIFSQSKYLIISSLASVIYLKIDIVMLEAMRPIEEVGVYAVAAKLSEVWYVFPRVVIIAMFPKLLEIAAKNQPQYERILQKGFDTLFICALSLSVFVYLVSPWFIELVYGATYNDAAAILRLHIFASLFIYMRLLLSQWLVSERFAEFSLFSQVFGAFVNIVLNWWLIPLYGPWGAAVATVISYATSTYLCLFFFKRTRKMALMMTKAMLFPFRIHKILKPL